MKIPFDLSEAEKLNERLKEILEEYKKLENEASFSGDGDDFERDDGEGRMRELETEAERITGSKTYIKDTLQREHEQIENSGEVESEKISNKVLVRIEEQFKLEQEELV